ncbi:MAG: GAF domain-containing protein, partial [Verrucomicrobiales bacterium]|nr:GAF domain-containing protein [Verrucomicrobiales bacterium]
MPPSQEWIDHRIREDEGRSIEAGLTIGHPPRPLSAAITEEAERYWAESRIELAVEAHARAAERERQALIGTPRAQAPARRLATLACARAQLAARQYAEARQTVADSLDEDADPATANELRRVQKAATIGAELASYQELQLKRSDQETMHELHRIVARALERFHATSAILFEPHENLFRPLLVRQDTLESFTLHREDASIVTHVARTRQPYCAEVSLDPNVPFRPSIPGAASELAIPLVDSEDALLAVLYLASTASAAFSPAQMSRLEELTAGLVPFLRLRRARAGWHFRRHGWDMHRYLDDLCANVCGVLRAHGSRVACLVWRRDPTKDEIYLAGTDGYDSEYETQPLPSDCFTSSVTRLPRGRILSGPWRDFPEFSRPDKAERMGIRRIASTPIYLPGAREAVGALSIYYFGECPVLENSILVHLADIVARELALHDDCRPHVARAWCQAEIAQRALDSVTAFELIKQNLLKCLAAPACSIFAKLKDSPRLVLVSTTGLEEGDRPVTDLESVQYNLEDPHGGLTWHLGRSPELCIRRNDVLNSAESGFGQSIHPQNRYREQFGLGPTDHRRFLGISVTDDATSEVLGVIRLNRPTDSPPFTPGDEQVLRAVASTAVRAYRDWRNEESRKNLVPRGLGQLGRRAALDAFGSLLRPLPSYNRSISGLCQKVLHDMLDLSRSQGAFQASVRELVATDDGFEELRVIAFASTQHAGGAAGACERRGRDNPPESDSVAWQCLDTNKVLSFDRERCAHLVKPIDVRPERVVCGANLPILASRAGRRIRGVFAIDFASPVRWNGSMIWG